MTISDRLLLAQLKSEGHKLLEEYIALDVRESVYKEKTRSYNKLSSKLPFGQSPHFSKMTTLAEVRLANQKLTKMIRRRKSKLDWENK